MSRLRSVAQEGDDVYSLENRVVILERTIRAAGPIPAGAVGEGAIAQGAINSSHLQANSVATIHLQADSVKAGKIDADAITAREIAADAVTANEIKSATITATQIASATITATQIASQTITATQIATDTITATQIAANAITTSELNANAVTAAKLNVTVGSGNFLTNSSFEQNLPDGTKTLASQTTGWRNPNASTWEIVNSSTDPSLVHGFGSALKITSVSVSDYIDRARNATSRIPLAAGDKFVGSGWIYLPVAATVRVGARAFLSATTATQDGSQAALDYAVPANVWTRVTSGVRTAPNTGNYGDFFIQVLNAPVGTVYYVDDMQLELGDVATSYAPKADEIPPGTIVASQILTGTITATQIAADTITANEIAANAITASELNAGAVTANKLNVIVGGGNLVKDSSFEATTGNFVNSTNAGSVTQTTEIVRRAGTKALRWTALGNPSRIRYNTTAATLIPVTPGVSYTLSGFLATTATSRTGSVRCFWYDSALAIISGSDIIGNPVPINSTSYTRVSGTGVAPAGAAYLSLAFHIPVSANGEFYYVDDTQVEEGDVLTAYAPNTSEILPGTINAGMLQADSVTAASIKAGEIDTVHLKANAVTADKIAANAVTTNKLLVTAGGGNLIGDSSFETGGLAGWVGNATIASQTGTDAKHGNKWIRATFASAISGAKIAATSGPRYFVPANSTVTFSAWIRGNVGTTVRMHGWTYTAATGGTLTEVNPTINNPNYGLITPDPSIWKRIVGSYTPASDTWFVAGMRLSLTTANTYLDVDAYQLEEGDVASSYSPKADEILPGTIVADMIQAEAITADKIKAGEITAGKLAVDSVSADNIQTNAITSVKIKADEIDTLHLRANSVKTANIDAGSVTAIKIAVNDLSAITSNLGNITAGTITGGTIQTSTSGARVILSTAGLVAYALNGTTKVFEINAGTGVASFTGIANIATGSVVPTSTFSGIIPAANIPLLGGGNAFSDSSFSQPTTAVSSTNWGGENATYVHSNEAARFGTQSAKVTTAGTANTGINANTTAKYIPVQAGQPYTLSAYVKPGTATGGSPRVVLAFYDAALTSLSGSNVTVIGTTLAAGQDWQRIVATGTAPATATSLRCYIRVIGPGIAVGDTYYIDGVQLENSSVASAYAPRPDEILPDTITGPEIQAGAITTAKMTANTINGNVIQALTLDAGKITSKTVDTLQLKAGAVDATIIKSGSIQTSHLTVDLFNSANLVQNSSFEDDTFTATTITKWSNVNTANSTVTVTNGVAASHGARVAIGTSVGATTIGIFQGGIPVTVGRTYVGSAYIQRGTIPATGIGRVDLWWYDSGGSFLSGTNGTALQVTLTNTGWYRAIVSATAPANAVTARLFIYATGASAAGQTAYFDAAQVEEQGTVPGQPTVYQPKYGEILTGSVGPTQITPNSITTDKLVTNNLSANAISIKNLSAIDGEFVSLNSGTITGATIRTASSGARVELNTINGIRGYASDGSTVLYTLSNAGLTLAATGVVQTGTTGARVVLSTEGLKGYDASSVETFSITGSGVSIAGGTISGGTFTGGDIIGANFRTSNSNSVNRIVIDAFNGLRVLKPGDVPSATLDISGNISVYGVYNSSNGGFSGNGTYYRNDQGGSVGSITSSAIFSETAKSQSINIAADTPIRPGGNVDASETAGIALNASSSLLSINHRRTRNPDGSVNTTGYKSELSFNLITASGGIVSANKVSLGDELGRSNFAQNKNQGIFSYSYNGPSSAPATLNINQNFTVPGTRGTDVLVEYFLIVSGYVASPGGNYLYNTNLSIDGFAPYTSYTAVITANTHQTMMPVTATQTLGAGTAHIATLTADYAFNVNGQAKLVIRFTDKSNNA